VASGTSAKRHHGESATKRGGRQQVVQLAIDKAFADGRFELGPFEIYCKDAIAQGAYATPLKADRTDFIDEWITLGEPP
jgi:hypothetical protein